MSRKVVGFINLYNSPELGDLTANRTLGSTSFLGRFAVIDFALSNFTNSGIDDINVLCKNHFRSLSKHVGSLKTWANNTKIARQHILLNEAGILRPSTNTDLNNLRENRWLFTDQNVDYVVIQPAHIVTTINFEPIIEKHIASGADITLVYKNITDGKQHFGTCNIVELEGDKVVEFVKNTQAKNNVTVSLESYVMSKKVLFEILENQLLCQRPLKEVIEVFVKEQRKEVYGVEYKGYARSFDSFEHFVEYSFELLDLEVATTLFDIGWDVYTVTRNTPPTMYGPKSSIKNSYIANGAIVKGSVENSIISRGAIIDEGAVVKNSIVMARSHIKAGSKVSYCLLDKDVTIEEKASVSGKKNATKLIEQGKVVK